MRLPILSQKFRLNALRLEHTCQFSADRRKAKSQSGMAVRQITIGGCAGIEKSPIAHHSNNQDSICSCIYPLPVDTKRNAI